MEQGLRKRVTGGHGKQAPSKEESKASTGRNEGNEANDGKSKPSFISPWTAGNLVLVTLHLLAIAIFIAGFVWRISLHTGTECEMTYSYPNFLEVETEFQSPSKLSDAYKLYKFVDGRDPRYQLLLQAPQPLEGNGHCSRSTNATLVLYIPGHWGSYTQARSVGAHGTQWTRAHENTNDGQQRMVNGGWHGKADRLDHFIYEVYSVDFAEQGGALHGRFLERQSDFVAHTVRWLSATCKMDSITVIAHSMGGYVARMTPIRHPDTHQLLPNILTLATPHGNPLYAFDETIHQFHELLNDQQDGNTLLVSISGGLRDEMIETKACETGLEDSHSYLTTNILSNSLLGMDHRAIVWCHSVLERVRNVIWTLSKDPNENIKHRSAKIVQVLGTTSYKEAVDGMTATLVDNFGRLQTMAMETAMLYNLPLLYGLYAMVAGLHWALVGTAVDATIYRLVSVVFCCYLWADVSIMTATVLSLVANSIHQLLLSGLRFLSPRMDANQRSRSSWFMMSIVAAFGVLGLFATLRILVSWSTAGLLGCIFFLAGIVAVIVACFAMSGKSTNLEWNIAFAALLLLTIPGIFAGAIMLMLWEQSVEFRSWQLWLCLVLPALIVGALKCSRPIAHKNARELAAMRVLVVFWTCQGVLARGDAYRVSHMVVGVATTEMIFELVDRMPLR